LASFSAGIPVPERRPHEERVTGLEGEDRELFLRLTRKMLQWQPEKRSSVAGLANDGVVAKTSIMLI
jgi:hypothetical protein